MARREGGRATRHRQEVHFASYRRRGRPGRRRRGEAREAARAATTRPGEGWAMRGDVFRGGGGRISTAAESWASEEGIGWR